MLSDLGSYGLNDFLQFSQETYFRMFELYNRDVWPLHLLALVLAAALLGLVHRRHGSRIAAGLLALLWAWVAWAFFLERYATIMIAAPYFAALFGLEAVLIAGIGAAAGRIQFAERTGLGLGLMLFAMFLNPLIGILEGRNLQQLEFFGMGPDPTAIATIGFLLATEGRMRWMLLVPAIIWCAVSVLTSLAMGSVEMAGPVIAVVAVIIHLVRREIHSTSETEG